MATADVADLADGHSWRPDRPALLLETSMLGCWQQGTFGTAPETRVAASVGEGAVAIQLLHQLFAPDRRQPHGRPEDRLSVIGR